MADEPKRGPLTPLQRAAMNAIAQDRADDDALFRTCAMVRAQAEYRPSLAPGLGVLSMRYEAVTNHENDEKAVHEIANAILGSVAADLLEYLPNPAEIPKREDRERYESLRRRLLRACGRECY